ncbi:Hint domain-containing protein [Jiella endophytica]|uniref:Hint domain-containing protein n=1 Tax=Jiella endophytica TaxID=2558362 RepID=A0A4Y8RPL7_9HYPH|nr:Hint domain-containing protein [Jiella endophytica]TFF25592.1 Hint domain-containing protein [Jiella endophytica]
MATSNPLQFWRVTKNSQYNYTVVSDTGSVYTVTDDGTDPGDNPNILGDVDPDNFQDSGGLSDIYRSALQNGRGFIAYSPTYGYYLFQYAAYYTAGATITTVNADFAICFASGTRIETARGPVAVEDLEIGDMAVTASGAERPIRWIGRRVADCTGKHADEAPVRVRAGAFADGVPARDVLLSPGHPVLARRGGREFLVPIKQLVNGTSITRSRIGRVTYWHVELDEHDILLAEGLPAESFFERGGRNWFGAVDLDEVAANPGLVPEGERRRCRPVAFQGPLVEAERQRLAARVEAGQVDLIEKDAQLPERRVA